MSGDVSMQVLPGGHRVAHHGHSSLVGSAMRRDAQRRCCLTEYCRFTIGKQGMTSAAFFEEPTIPSDWNILNCGEISAALHISIASIAREWRIPPASEDVE